MDNESLTQMSIFDFTTNDQGEYVSIEEEKGKNWHDYSLEELIKNHESNDSYVVCSKFHLAPLCQCGLTVAEIQEQIQKEAESKTYHYGNMELDIYVYSFKLGDDCYLLIFENPKHLVGIIHHGKIEEILRGEKNVCFPACEVYMWEQTENGVKYINSGYSDNRKEEDIRYKIICGEFKVLEFSKNRIYPNKKPMDFCEAEFKLEDFINYYGDKENTEINC